MMIKKSQNTRHFLELALQEAERAFKEGNYPIGSVVTNAAGNILSQKRNQSITENDVSAHAEMLTLKQIGDHGEDDLILFSSLEPCFGCSFFIARSNITQVYSALKDPHLGGISDLKAQDQFTDFFGTIELVHEPFADLREKSRNLMREYFLQLGEKEKAEFYKDAN